MFSSRKTDGLSSPLGGVAPWRHTSRMQDDEELADMTRLINEEREAFGVPHLKRDGLLDHVASRHVIYLLAQDALALNDPINQRDRQRLEGLLVDNGVSFRS